MKIFTREVKIALSAIVAIVLVYLLINFMKGVNVFKSSNTYYVRFDNIAGLAVSNAVYANGYPVGIVRGIQYDYGIMSALLWRLSWIKKCICLAERRLNWSPP